MSQVVSFGTSKTPEEQGVTLSDSASEKVSKLKKDEKNENLKLRVYITGGGCSGFQYGFKFDEDVADDDVIIENNGVEMLIDAMSMQYLGGSVVDFESGLEGEKFFITNPNATSTCGCGLSFSV